ncbi:hypothetical protein NCCP133_03630 [Cytobacillus sp. NCCP-133]|nr:hypothetical protein NCCP133_03630 [Cytobacillus sp. NCCP-133]
MTPIFPKAAAFGRAMFILKKSYRFFLRAKGFADEAFLVLRASGIRQALQEGVHSFWKGLAYNPESLGAANKFVTSKE